MERKKKKMEVSTRNDSASNSLISRSQKTLAYLLKMDYETIEEYILALKMCILIDCGALASASYMVFKTLEHKPDIGYPIFCSLEVLLSFTYVLTISNSVLSMMLIIKRNSYLCNFYIITASLATTFYLSCTVIYQIALPSYILLSVTIIGLLLSTVAIFISYRYWYFLNYNYDPARESSITRTSQSEASNF